jgi:serine/threonine protein kinase
LPSLDDFQQWNQELAVGTVLEEFVIERVLGSGGFGITYLAKDMSLNRQVVIKENLPVDLAWRDAVSGTVRPRHNSDKGVEDYEWALMSFLRESETLATLDHPGIVRVLRKFETNGTAYFVMPYHDGWAFSSEIDLRRTEGAPFSEDEITGFLEHMLDALAYLHARGIYHRDIKPANILLAKMGVPLLIDFGAARQKLSERSMTVIESHGYTPFEQTQSRGNVGPWSDLYALGGTVFKAITFETPPKVNDRALEDSLISLACREELLEHYSKHLLAGVDRAMAVRVEKRWQSAEAWLEFVNKTC